MQKCFWTNVCKFHMRFTCDCFGVIRSWPSNATLLNYTQNFGISKRKIYMWSRCGNCGPTSWSQKGGDSRLARKPVYKPPFCLPIYCGFVCFCHRNRAEFTKTGTYKPFAGDTWIGTFLGMMRWGHCWMWNTLGAHHIKCLPRMDETTESHWLPFPFFSPLSTFAAKTITKKTSLLNKCFGATNFVKKYMQQITLKSRLRGWIFFCKKGYASGINITKKLFWWNSYKRECLKETIFVIILVGMVSGRCWAVPLTSVLSKLASALDSWALKPSCNFLPFPAMCPPKTLHFSAGNCIFLQDSAFFCMKLHFL